MYVQPKVPMYNLKYLVISIPVTVCKRTLMDMNQRNTTADVENCAMFTPKASFQVSVEKNFSPVELQILPSNSLIICPQMSQDSLSAAFSLC